MRDSLADLVQRWNGHDAEALAQLVDLLYDDLRQIAHAHLRLERPEHTLSTTAVVHETYAQLAARDGPEWRGRGEFFALVSKVMRNVLVNYARRRRADKRGGTDLHVPLSDDLAAEGPSFELLAVNQALDRLAIHDRRLAQLVECRFFGGMSEADIARARALGVSTRTVERDWIRARAYLFTMPVEVRR